MSMYSPESDRLMIFLIAIPGRVDDQFGKANGQRGLPPCFLVYTRRDYRNFSTQRDFFHMVPGIIFRVIRAPIPGDAYQDVYSQTFCCKERIINIRFPVAHVHHA